MSDEGEAPETAEESEGSEPTEATASVESQSTESTGGPDGASDDESAKGSGSGLSGGKIAAIVVVVVLVAGLVVGLIASKRQKDDEGKGSSAAAATVDGTSISQGTLDSEIAAWTANKDYVKAAAAQGQAMVGADGQPTPEFQRAILTQQIEDILFRREFNREHLKVTTADEASLRSQVAGNAALQKYPKKFLDSIIERAARVTVLQSKLTKAPTEAQIEQAYNQQYSCTSNKDVAHILVASLATANDLETQLASGADFATLAKSKSTDTGSAPSGGALGCLKRGAFVKPFEDAAFGAQLNKPTAPVKSQFGYHIILVTPHANTATPSLASVRQQIVQQLQQDPTQFNAFVDKLFGAAKVSVNHTFGAWTKTANGYAVTVVTASTRAKGAGPKGSASAANTTPLPVADGRPHKH